MIRVDDRCSAASELCGCPAHDPGLRGVGVDDVGSNLVEPPSERGHSGGIRPRPHRAAKAIDAFSGHSLRVGAAQDLLTRGHDGIAIMRAGGWKSMGVLSRYLEYAEHNVWETNPMVQA